MNREDKLRALEYIKNLFPDAHCELVHTNDLELLIATILSAQATDKSVNKLTESLFKKYTSVYDYEKASLEELASDIKTIGLYHSKARSIKNLCHTLITEYDGKIPVDKKKLESLAGVGPKTANVFLAVRYNYPLMAVDTHVKRVSRRLYFAAKDDDEAAVEKKLYKLIDKDEIVNFHHRLIFFGRYFCKAVNPNCEVCELKNQCRYIKEKEKQNGKRTKRN